MKATLNLQRGLVQTSILGLLLVGTALTGCGTDFSTAPSLTTVQADDDIGTIKVNPRRGLPAPHGATAELIGVNAVLVRWSAPVGNLEAMLKVDGREIARVSATESSFLDTSPKSAGTHTYELCFARGKSVGDPAYLMIDIAERNGDGGERRGDEGDDIQGQ